MQQVESMLNNYIDSDGDMQNEIKTNDSNISHEDTNDKPQLSKVIDIEDFVKIDLRIAKILNAEEVVGSDKLLKLTLDVGVLGIKQVFSGIKSAYMPQDLIGKCTVVVANLKERKMRFGLSQGMVLAASGEDHSSECKQLWILEPHLGAQPGMRVK